MSLEKDTIWNAFEGGSDFESFQENILQPIYLKGEVPDDIKAEIKIVEKLLLHSYYEYNFIDLALSQAVFALEKSLRIRYSEVNNKSSSQLTFFKLIDWFFDEIYFEILNKGILTQLRNIRNGKVHNEKKTLGGIAFLHKVYTVVYLINDLYEDPLLRISRHKLIMELQEVLTDLMKEGAVISIDGKRSIIFKADVVFVNNKVNTQILNLVIWPIFNPEIYKNEEDNLFRPYCFEVELTNWDIKENVFNGFKISDNEEVFISSISDETNHEKFTKWQKEFYAIPNSSLILFLTTDLNKFFYSALNKFHQVD
jgi:hypothetical protein